MENPQALALASLAKLETAAVDVAILYRVAAKLQTPEARRKHLAALAAFGKATQNATDALAALDLHDVAVAVGTYEPDDLPAAIAAARAAVVAR